MFLSKATYNCECILFILMAAARIEPMTLALFVPCTYFLSHMGSLTTVMIVMLPLGHPNGPQMYKKNTSSFGGPH